MVAILKFTHCGTAEIFAFNIPSKCPICGDNLLGLRSPPVAIQTPFVNGVNRACSVLVKPTIGSFLGDYVNGANLHTGVTNTEGCVYSYDENGIHIDSDSNSWKQSLAIPIVDFVDEELKDVWDERLQSMMEQPSWKAIRYHPDTHNCFDFVIEFLNYMNFNIWKEKCNEAITRTQFSTAYVLPATSRAARYIGLYRSIQLYGAVTQK